MIDLAIGRYIHFPKHGFSQLLLPPSSRCLGDQVSLWRLARWASLADPWNYPSSLSRALMLRSSRACCRQITCLCSFQCGHITDDAILRYLDNHIADPTDTSL